MDKRRAPRIRTLLQARAVYDGGNVSLDCLVRNQSSGGMRLAISQAVILPDEFDLHIPKRNVVRRVRLTWRTADEIGVAFAPEAPNSAISAPSAGDPAARIMEIEAEMSRLETALRALKEQRDQMVALAPRRGDLATPSEEARGGHPPASVATVDVFDDTTGEWMKARTATDPRGSCR